MKIVQILQALDRHEVIRAVCEGYGIGFVAPNEEEGAEADTSLVTARPIKVSELTALVQQIEHVVLLQLAGEVPRLTTVPDWLTDPDQILDFSHTVFKMSALSSAKMNLDMRMALLDYLQTKHKQSGKAISDYSRACDELLKAWATSIQL